MIITDIKLEGFKHFSLANINSLEARFTAPLQLVIGTNGSGKSSLLRQLTPMPATGADFNKGGAKVITIEHSGNTYTLESNIGSTGHHSFKKNGSEELNKGGTALVQKDLIESELEFTPALQKIVTGNVKFSTMSPTQAMKVLIDASDLNLDYAFSLYDIAKEKIRDVAGALKHIEVKLSGIQDKLSDEEEMARLRERSETIREEIRALLPLLSSNTDYALAENLYNEKETRLTAVIDKCTKVLTRVSWYPNRSLDEVRLELDRLTSDLNRIETLYSEKSSQLLAETEVINKLRNTTDIVDLNEINERITYLKNIVVNITGYAFTEINDLEGLKHKLAEFNSNLSNAISDFNLGNIKLWTTEEINELKASMTLVKEEIAKGETKITNDKHRLALHGQTVDSNVTCKSCGTVNLAKGALTEEQIIAIRKGLEETGRYVDGKKLELEKLTELAETTEEFKRAFHFAKTQILLLGDSARELNITIRDYLTSPNSFRESINKLLPNIDKEIARRQAEVELERLESVRTLLEKNSIETALAKERILTDELSDLNAEKRTGLTRKLELEGEVKLRELLETTLTEASTLLEDVDGTYRTTFDSFMAKKIRELIYAKETQLSSITSTLQNHDHYSKVKEELVEDERRLLDEKSVLERVAKELSPKVGLISQQLRIFLQDFFTLVNDTVGRIFEYDIEVRVAKNDSALDFKFPLYINGAAVGDITCASEGQKDVFDLAFTLALMAAKKLHGVPLFLDEMGSTFDPAHRDNLVAFIKYLLESGRVEQIFMISHYSEMTGGLVNNESLVLHADNLTTIPSNSNAHVKIT